MRRGVLTVIVVVAAVTAAVISFRLGSEQTSSAPVSNDEPSVVASPVAMRPSTESTSSPPGQAPDVAASAFVSAFLDTGKDRNQRLTSTASDRLAQLLARTDPAKISTSAPVGPPRVVSVTDVVTTLTQRLSDGTSIAFDLVPDNTRPSGWVVTSVRAGER